MILLFEKVWVPPPVSPPFSVGNVYKPDMQIRGLIIPYTFRADLGEGTRGTRDTCWCAASER
eukprot:8846579-Pyramimonas_sp.AAC.1